MVTAGCSCYPYSFPLTACVHGQVSSCEHNLARVREYSYSNSSHPLRRLPKTSVRFVVETRISPLSFSTPTMRSCTSKSFDEKPPSNGVNPINRSLVMKTAP